MRDMSEDYATMIENELGGPVSVMGLSTGGAIAQHYAVDHPDLVDRLVLVSTGYSLSEGGAELQRKVIRFQAREMEVSRSCHGLAEWHQG